MTREKLRVYGLVDLGDDVAGAVVTELEVQPGHPVTAGQALFSVESAVGVMTNFWAEGPGFVTAVLAFVGQLLTVDQAVVEVDET